MSDTQGERPENTSTPSETTPAAPAGDAAAPPLAQSFPPRPPLPGSEQQATPVSHTAPTTPVPPYTGQAAPGYPTQGAPARPYGTQPSYGGTAPYAGASFGGAAYGAPGAHPTQQTLPLPGAAAPTAPAPKQKSGAGKVAGLVIAAALVGGAAGLGGAYAGVNIWGASQVGPIAGPAAVTVNDTDSVNATTAISAKVVPSVVTISASSDSSGGTGSGVVLSEDGYVVTNTHVVTLDGATSDAELSVTTSDGRVFAAELVGTDPTYDLAVIKLVDASGLTPIEFADSSDLNVGDQTVAVGAPLGLANTVTTGIVSALNRSIEIASSAAPESTEGDGTEGDGSEGDGSEGDGSEGEGEQDSPFYFDFGQGQGPQEATSSISIAVIQTDAAINPGNSGGALVDSEGKLIGINVAIATAGSSGESGSIGVGFSIPSNVVERVANELIEDGAATHGLLGAMVAPATSIEGTTITGAYIDGVTDGGAAASAGLREGDIVTGFGDIPITDAVDLTAQVRAAAGGSEVTLTFVRGDETRTVDVTLGSLDQ